MINKPTLIESEQEPLYERLRKVSDIIDYEAIEAMPRELRDSFSVAMGSWVLGDCHGFLEPPEPKDGHSDPAWFAESIARRVFALIDAQDPRLSQSPIEDMMLGALLWLDMDFCGFPEIDHLNGPKCDVHENWRPDGVRFMLTQQAKFENYTADFCLWFKAGRHCGGVVVECDGHSFHEKTKEQAARDKKRDRQMLLAGFPVMRFSGSEIFKDCAGCSEQVREVLLDPMWRVCREAGLCR